MKIIAYLFNFFFLSQFAFLPNANAQAEAPSREDDKKVTIHIKQDVNGEVSESTSTYSLEDFDLDEILEDLHIDMKDMENGLKDELQEMDFDIEIDMEGLESEIMELKKVIKIEMEDLEDGLIDLEKEFNGVAPHNVFIEKKMHHANQAFLGVHMDETFEGEGVRIKKVVKGSAAEKSGLKEGDILTQVDKQKVNDPEDLIEVLSPFKAGDEVKLTYLRDGEKVKGSAELTAHSQYKQKSCHDFEWNGAHSEDAKVWIEKRPFLGVTTVLESDESDEGAVTIMNVIPNSAAEVAGLQVGDVIRSVNNEKVEDVGHFAALIGSHNADEEVSLLIERDDEPMQVSAQLRERTVKMINCWKTPEDAAGKYELDFLDEEEGDFDIEIEEGDAGVRIYKFKSGGENDMDEQVITIEVDDRESDVSASEAEHRVVDEQRDITPGIVPNELEVKNLVFYPNPNEGQFNLKFNLEEKGDTEIRIYDNEGRKVYSEDLDKFSGSYEQMIDISEGAKGTYQLQIRQGDRVLNEQIVVQ